MNVNRINHRIQRTLSSFVCCLLPLFMAMVPATAQSPSDYYTEPQIYGMRPNPRGEVALGQIGVTGIEARIYRGVKVTVEETAPNTPAHGKFTKGDIIIGVNGVALKGRNPLPILGNALTRAEATDGVLKFDVRPGKEGKLEQVTINIPVMGAYSKTFPLNCAKSNRIIKQAAEFYSRKDRLKKHGFLNALACLFLLSTGNDQYVLRVKEYFSQFLAPDGSVRGIGDMTWDNGYNGVACAEYYLRTGDTSVLPILQHYCDDARDRQHYGLGWGHWGHGVNPAYEAGGGMQHSAGNQMLLTLLLGKVCGVNVDDRTLLGALRHWYRFVGHGAIPLSDQRNWHIFRSAGRDGGTAAVMHVASGAKGDVSIYRQAKEYLSMSALTSWPSRAYNWEVYWHSLAGHFMLEYDPGTYHMTMQRFRWRYDLSRQASGAFSFPGGHASLKATDAGISLALAYTAPLKALHITGAPRSKYAKDFTLPEHLWGNEADRAFLSARHNKDYYKFGDEEEAHIPFRQLPIRLRYGPQDVKALPLNVMLKNVRHARYTVRAGAAKALCMNRRLGELEQLLRDPDPRLRRAALDGINDSRPWFTSPAVGKHALKAEEFSPAMTEAITAIMSDPHEAWFVVDGALHALHHAPLPLVKKNIPNILAWTTHVDWWLREAAFMALMGLQEDEEFFIEHLPTMIEIMTKEYHYNPRIKMIAQLKGALAKWKNDSPVGKRIIDGFARAAMESEVRPDVGKYPRSREGTTNIIEVALASIKLAPEAAADLADSLAKSGRLDVLDTGSLMKIVKAADGRIHDRFIGLYPALKTVPPQQKQRLTDILFDDFRPELVKRLESTDKQGEAKLIDMIVDLTRLKKQIAGWEAIGAPKPAERIWRFHSFNPLTEKEELHPRIGPPKRLRDVTLPAAMDKWYKPEFDDGKWKSGKAPIGVGEFKAHGHGRGWTATPNHFFKNNSDWGDGEFLVMRTTFDVTDLDYDYHRISILADQGYHIYLNGHKIHTYVWFRHYPTYYKIMLTEKEIKHLKKGTNTLAVYCNVRYEKDKKTDAYHPVGQMDLFIEGLKKSDIGL
ncbi:MAG: DUF6288 domain-containing protein [Planctomycetota bacterium]|nr:DUF6288 domain-containing protein [Planctomycetota bacterium]